MSLSKKLSSLGEEVSPAIEKGYKRAQRNVDMTMDKLNKVLKNHERSFMKDDSPGWNYPDALIHTHKTLLELIYYIKKN